MSRLDSHLQQGFALLDDQEKPAGRTIEQGAHAPSRSLTEENLLRSNGGVLQILIQEMLREVNTIGSKASDIEIANLTIHMKSESEKIREQIQNVE